MCTNYCYWPIHSIPDILLADRMLYTVTSQVYQDALYIQGVLKTWEVTVHKLLCTGYCAQTV